MRTTELKATPLIHQLVREGRATPDEGAHLIELRRSLQKQRVRRSRGFAGTVLFTLVFVVLGLFGIRRQSA